ncbi:MAG: hypothetical protein JW875_01890 [Spirochaetales bacterium]|nr:hypothetical protein [Spirochaetales bacterium]
MSVDIVKRLVFLLCIVLFLSCSFSSRTKKSDEVQVQPGALSATGGYSQILLTWESSKAAVQYGIQRSATETGPFTEITTSQISTYIDKGLADESLWYYRIRAFDASGHEAFSNIAWAKTQRLNRISMADPKANALTRALFEHLQGITAKREAGSGILTGQDAAYGVGLFMYHSEKDGKHSDVHTLTGKAPAVVSYDAASIVGDWWNESDPWYHDIMSESQANYKKWMKAQHEAGGFNTLHWHMRNYVNGGSYSDGPHELWRIAPPEVCAQMTSRNLSVPNAGSHFLVFKAKVDILCDWLLELKDSSGHTIPVVFRPFHENSGEWFWWGKTRDRDSQVPLAEYQASLRGIWKWMVEYMSETRGVHNLIWAISPNGHGSWDPYTAEEYLMYSPDPAYIDIFGFDQYVTKEYSSKSGDWEGGVIPEVTMIVELAREHHKAMAITEGGFDWGFSPMTLKHNRVIREENGNTYIDWELAVDENRIPVPIGPLDQHYRYEPSNNQRDFVPCTLEESTIWHWWTEKTIGKINDIGGVAYYVIWSNGVPGPADNPKNSLVYGPVPGNHTGDDFIDGWKRGIILLAGEGKGGKPASLYYSK